ncbi:cellulase family glycosylhydrolase (plasmid) [Rhizobium sp. 32-5/1]|uniref:glycoside hydrolase family 5 protein n=1 Tax=Rhizobium sp. 32-5/1 TaxID=3019602 RepID=UPI00240E5DE9|nr:cellulase family glycosylhydrolase [Rhizobium sp. 32-5/1]WEZ85874.1 cellulase family glycosylhydrolase [Rhizobium sp. 32-5/1]
MATAECSPQHCLLQRRIKGEKRKWLNMRSIVALLSLLMIATTLQASPLRLSRGVGVHEWLNWSPVEASGSYRRPPYRSVEQWLNGGRSLSDWPKGNEFSRIKAMGFDFIRLSVDPGPLLAGGTAERNEALDVLSESVRQATDVGLSVVFDLHAVGQVPAYSRDFFDGAPDSEGVLLYRAMAKDVAAMLVRIGTSKVAFEPYNEPAQYPCGENRSGDWQQIMADTVADIRKVSSELTIIATGACGGSITGLLDIDPFFDDANILYSFHMYEPHSFTHQKAQEPNGFASGLPWPASRGSPEQALRHLQSQMRIAGVSRAEEIRSLAKAEEEIKTYFKTNWGKATLKARIGEAVTWAERNDIPPSRLFMGEFGVIRMAVDKRSGAFDGDRLRYLRTVRETAEENGIAWSVWEYANPYGMTLIEPKGKASPDKDMLQALGLPTQ